MTVRACLAIAALVGLLSLGCGTRTDTTVREADQGGRFRPARYRFEDDRVTCYALSTNAISCLRDAG